jgi:hypothetical protein
MGPAMGRCMGPAMGRCIRVDFGTITGDLIKLTGSGALVSEALGVAVEAPMGEVLLMGVALGVPGLTLASLADVLGLELWADWADCRLWACNGGADCLVGRFEVGHDRGGANCQVGRHNRGGANCLVLLDNCPVVHLYIFPCWHHGECGCSGAMVSMIGSIRWWCGCLGLNQIH